ncbi:MAG: PTS sugar transporter subunit IIA [Eubacteriales bacterium]|nr:PTS sugar transporter subunit IIA [Eubacteriales bacterium]
MTHIIMVSHGEYVKAMIESAELIVGEKENVTTFGFNLGDSVDQLQESIANELKRVQKNSDVLVLTDMFSGSPFNAVSSLMQEYSFHHITGINLPLLLEILMSRDETSVQELCNNVMEKGKDTIVYVNKFLEEME